VRHATTGFFPLDKRWEITVGVYSPECTKQMVWVATQVAYEAAAEMFARLARRTVPVDAIWDETQRHGERLKGYLAQQARQVAVERVSLPPAGVDHHRPLGLSLDGGLLHIRGEGWKEFKVGTVFEVVITPERDPITGEWIDQAHAVQMEYCAVLGTVNAFAAAFWALAVGRQVPQAAQVSVTPDGAEWIWNLVADLFPDSVQIVDWFHACEHLAQAAEGLFPADLEAARAWQHERRTDLYLGQIHKITEPLERAGLAALAEYFHKHDRRMHYQEFREQACPIGSGTVESAIKGFKTRLTGPGMRWSRPAAERMLVLRAAVLSGTFDDLWAAARN